MRKRTAFALFSVGLGAIIAVHAALLKSLDPAPNFSLPAYQGKTISLTDYSTKKNVVLVFYRGWVGYW